MPTRQHTTRADSLTGARFIAALVVFAFHAANVGLLNPATRTADVLVTVTKSAAISVSFFFVLSGFVLTWSVRPDDTYRGFLRRRLVKIFPNHLVTFCVALVVLAAASTPPGTLALNALLLQSWVSDPAVFLSVNGSSWSISCELFFYALFPLLFAAVRAIPARWLWPTAAAVAGAITLIPVAARLIPADPVFDAAEVGKLLGGESIHRMWFVYIFPLSRLFDFVLGIVVARIVLSGRWIGLPVRWAALLAAAGYVGGLFTPMLFTVDAVAVVPVASLVASLAAADAAGRPTFLAGRTMRFLGNTSFAFYLVHGLVLMGMQARFGQGTPLSLGQSVVLILAGFVLSLLLAAALHRFVEMPAVRRWGSFRSADGSADNSARATTATPAGATSTV